MNFVKLVKKYSNEEACLAAFKLHRDQQGVQCCKCGSMDHYWLQNREQYQCKQCKFRTTLRSGTLLESSKLPYHYWFIAIIMVTQSKKSVSALEMQTLLGHKRYEPIWFMIRKIRKAMGNVERSIKQEGEIELDDAFVIAVDTDRKNKTVNQPGRGSNRNVNILVSAEVKRAKGKHYNSGKKSKVFRNVKMEVIDDASSVSINSFVSGNISPSSQIITDGWKGFNNVNATANKHHQYIIPPEQAPKVLPWVHIMIANLKRNLLGIYHNVSKKYIQEYLDEFCYKTNRTKQPDFFEIVLLDVVKDTAYGKFRYKNG